MTLLPPTSSGRVVGDLACQRDSYLRTIDTEVISCVKLPPQIDKKAGTKGKAKSAGGLTKTEPPPPAPDSWLLEFNDSVLFPQGGGQPSDHGTLSPITGDLFDPICITFVQRQGLRCVYHSPKPLPPGTVVRQELDFRRRWDHMQQHTGQHLLSAIMDTYDKLETVGWGMGAENEPNYVDLPRKPSQEEMRDIQVRCNESIRNNLTITVETPNHAKADSLPGDYDKEKGVVRVIKIGDIDANTCCGTHLSQTSHLSLIILHSTQSVHSKNCRLYFTVGERAINLATSSIHSLSTIAKIMSSGTAPVEVIASVKKTNDAATALKRTESKLLMEIAKFEGIRVKSDLLGGNHAWVYRSTPGLDFINMVVFEIKEAITEDRVVLLASGEEKAGGQVVIIGNKDSVEALVSKVKQTVAGIKGGGTGTRWQGKVVEWRKGELDALRELVEPVRLLGLFEKED